jgi:YidC/Oxa1 family membrane protein insertase
MRNNALNLLLFFVLATGLWFFWSYAEKNWFPKPKSKDGDPAAQVLADAQKLAEQRAEEEAKRTTLASVSGIAITVWEQAKREAEVEAARLAAEKARDSQLAPAWAIAGVAPTVYPLAPIRPTLIALGDATFYNQVLLSTRGAGIQQLILPQFEEADRLGRPVNGVPLHLIPGVPPSREQSLSEVRIAPSVPPTLQPGEVQNPAKLAEPAFTVFHYPSPDDKHPDPFLGETNWQVVSEERLPGGEHKVVFEAELGAPYYVRFRKIYTLAPTDYHVGLRIEIERFGGQKGQGQLRYQLSGPRGLPIEGEWYTTTYRVAQVGYLDRKGSPRRQYEDAATIGARRGGEVVNRGDNTFKYWGVNTQYFASCVAIDDRADDTFERGMRNPIAYVRATTELPFDVPSNPRLPYFDDITVRAASETLDLAPGEKIAHSFLIYNGPAKVRLLGMMQGDRAVSPELVERYQEKLGLQTLTDFRSDNWIGRFANFIYWTDLVIAFTNLMHWLLYMIHQVIPWWAISIVVLTIMVRLLLLVPSKKQTQMNMKMMEVQKRLAPQFEELKKQYANDPSGLHNAKMRLMMANGVNPFVMMGGCLLLLAQMPIMMGLYFCLQESVFFRLEPFMWVQNLAAPDMLLWWGESIPFLTTERDMGSMLYLGPYLNILPLLAVGLMLWHQTKMMPPPADEQMAQQQRLMKFTMIMMAVLFYKVAAGLALYFIVGAIWGLIERRLIPKATDAKPEEDTQPAVATFKPSTAVTPATALAAPPPKGFLGKLKQAMKEKMEELQKQAEEQARRQIRNKKDSPTPNGDSAADQRSTDRRDRKKKRRR